MSEIKSRIKIEHNTNWMQSMVFSVDSDTLVWIYSKDVQQSHFSWVKDEGMELKLATKQKACLVGRDVDFVADYSVSFADFSEGTVSLLIRARILEPEEDQPHHLLANITFDWDATEEDVSQDLAQVLSKPFEPLVKKYFRHKSYTQRDWSNDELQRHWDEQSSQWPDNYGIFLRNGEQNLVIEKVYCAEGERTLQSLLDAERELKAAQNEVERNAILSKIRTEARLSEIQLAKLIALAEMEARFEVDKNAMVQCEELAALKRHEEIERARHTTLLEIIELDTRLTREQKEKAAELWVSHQKQENALKLEILQQRLNLVQERNKQKVLQNQLLAIKAQVLERDDVRRQEAAQLIEQLMNHQQLMGEQIRQTFLKLETMAEAMATLPVTMKNALAEIQENLSKIKPSNNIQARFRSEVQWASYSYIQEDGVGRIIIDREVCPDHVILKSGQALQVEMHVNRDCWFYLFNLGKYPDMKEGLSSYQWCVLYGNNGANDIKYTGANPSGNRIHAGQVLRMPRDSNPTVWRQEYWPLDNNAGTEVFFVVFTETPIPEDVVQQIRSHPPVNRPLTCRGILSADEDWAAERVKSELPQKQEPIEYAHEGYRLLEQAWSALAIHRLTIYHK